MKRKATIYILSILISLFLVSHFFVIAKAKTPKTYLDCSFKTVCDTDEVDVIHLYSLENSHVELSTENFYNYHLCCKLNAEDNSIDLKINPSSCEYGKLASLSSPTNAHVAEYDYYNYNICLDTTNHENGVILCQWKNSCESYETCMFSVYSKENTHAAECDYFPMKVCCAYGIKVPINVDVTLVNAFGIPVTDEKATMYVCEAKENICDEGSHWIYKVTNTTDNSGRLTINGKVLLFPGKKYKIGLVVSGGYAEAEITI